jgi:hypothetical protein
MNEESPHAAGETKGTRRAREVEPAAAGPVLRGSARRKQEAVLRLLRGEPLDVVGYKSPLQFREKYAVLVAA